MISVIVPAYNVESYLERAVNSVFNQDYKDWELIIINDGSTDNTFEVAQKISKKNNKVHLINQKNQGSGVARQNGLNFSKGKYIVFLDPDDFLEPGFFSNNTKIMEGEDVDVILNGYHYIYTDKLNRKKIDTNSYNKKEKISAKNFIENFEKYSKVSPRSLWNKMYKREFLKSNNICFTNQRVGQDALFNYLAYKYINYIFINTFECYNYDMTRDNSAIKKYNSLKWEYELNIANSFIDLLNSYDLKEEKEMLILKEYWSMIVNQVLNLSVSTCPLDLNSKVTLFSEQLKEIPIDIVISKMDKTYLNGFFEKQIYKFLKKEELIKLFRFSNFYNKMFFKY